MKDNAWFVGYAPCYKPEIVVSVLWESGVSRDARGADGARRDYGLFR